MARPVSSRVLRWSLAALACAAALPGWSRPAAAMTVLQVDLKTLVTASDLVLHGTIDRAQVLDRRKEGRGVWTEYTLAVSEVWKGEQKLAGQKFAWRHVGGTTADGMTVAVPGMPRFQPGEEVVVVLEKTAESWVVSAGPQGKFRVEKDGQGRRVVRRDLHDAHLVRKDPATGKLEHAPRTVPVTTFFGDFRTEVLKYVAEAAKAAQPPKSAPLPTKPGPTK